MPSNYHSITNHHDTKHTRAGTHMVTINGLIFPSITLTHLNKILLKLGPSVDQDSWTNA